MYRMYNLILGLFKENMLFIYKNGLLGHLQVHLQALIESDKDFLPILRFQFSSIVQGSLF